ncbi:serine hydrolase domain-containing protein [Streptomyces griseus]|uniref:Serine hydrolase domain-containing protein n=1 Tax=Streptomyces sp. CMC78 TaxID=3231512 RepID=A0AB33KFI3_9ACTN|nr:serine hydrolase domain-containing protein [Streptomyces sp. ID01-9D]MDX5574447.1 serine hydrolase [Streptomyces sp. ID01-9D]WSV22892.1 beta-lactamase family protein [Streptomyces fimicarius]WTC88211.1 beta-lactamase family protein [Streptomyces griseus]WTD69165.1 beta-lactamase family protein [Streptomyces griseus]
MTTSLVRQVLPRPRPRAATDDVHGTTAPGFASVRHFFERACRQAGPPGSRGAALAVVRDGELVVDLWHGTADPVTGTPWSGDTLVPLLTGSHGILATAVLLLADMGALELDAPVADHWPEFAVRGKGAVTLRDVLTFTARLPGMAAGLDQRDVENPRMMAALLELHSLEEDPRAGGVLHGPWTAGWIVAEVVRRVDGRDLDLFFLEEIAGPLGLDVHFGLVPDQLPQAARISYDEGFRARYRALDGGAGDGEAELFERVWNNPSPFPADAGVWSESRRRYAIVPSLGAYASARGLARLQGVLAADAVRAPGEEPLLLSRRTLDQARSFWAEGLDPLLGGVSAYGEGGLQLLDEGLHPAVRSGAFGHQGPGGVAYQAWPQAGAGAALIRGRLTAGPGARVLDEVAGAVARALRIG